MTPGLLFFLKIALGIWSFCGFIKILGLFFYFHEKCHCNFDKDCIKSVGSLVAWGSIYILTILILPIQEHRISFHFLVLLQCLNIDKLNNFSIWNYISFSVSCLYIREVPGVVSVNKFWSLWWSRSSSSLFLLAAPLLLSELALLGGKSPTQTGLHKLSNALRAFFPFALGWFWSGSRRCEEAESKARWRRTERTLRALQTICNWRRQYWYLLSS